MPDLVRPGPASRRRSHIEAASFAVISGLHVPGIFMAAGLDARTAVVVVLPVLAGMAVWATASVMALRAAARARLVSRTLLAVALAVEVVLMTVCGLTPPRPGNLLTAVAALLGVCAVVGVLTRPRWLPVVLVPAVVGQVVLVRAVDSGASTSLLVADTVTVVGISLLATTVTTWLDRERRRALKALATAAVTDPLTGLLNRRGLAEGFPALCSSGRAPHQERRDGEPGAAPRVVAVVVDIDHFKGVNDRRGHDIGDAVLVAVAEALRRCSREGDLLVRLGGEELAWVAVWPHLDDAVVAVERLRARIAEASRQVGEPVTVSVGIAVLPLGGPADAAALSGVLTRADGALYRAKAAGRDQVAVDPVEDGDLLAGLTA